MEDAFLVFPELETERFKLEQLGLDDLNAMFQIKSTPAVTHSYGRDPHTSLLQTESWIRIIIDNYRERKSLVWKIVDKTDGRIAGAVTLWNMDLESLMSEIGYELHPDYWRKGVMTETLNCLLDLLFGEFGLNRVEACPLQHNLASVKLLEKVGFLKEGTLKERVYFQGRFLDQYYYGLLKSEWDRKMAH